MTQVTVSRPFSGRGPVAEGTRRRIMEAAERLGYRPNLAARATRVGRTVLIGRIRGAHRACSVHAPEFDAGLDAALAERGLCLVRDTLPDATSDDASLPRIDRVLVPFARIGREAVAEVEAVVAHPGIDRPPVVVPLDFQRAGSVARPAA